jgi:hypothetical protein
VPGGRSEVFGKPIDRALAKERAAIFILPSDPQFAHGRPGENPVG